MWEDIDDDELDVLEESDNIPAMVVDVEEPPDFDEELPSSIGVLEDAELSEELDKNPWQVSTAVEKPVEEYTAPEIEITQKSDTIKYPYVLLELSSTKQYIANTLASLFRKPKGNYAVLDEATLTTEELKEKEDYESGYYGYIIIDDNNVIQPAGKLTGSGIRTLLENPLFKDVNKSIKLSETTTFTGDLLYALCPINAD